MELLDVVVLVRVVLWEVPEVAVVTVPGASLMALMRSSTFIVGLFSALSRGDSVGDGGCWVGVEVGGAVAGGIVGADGGAVGSRSRAPRCTTSRWLRVRG